MNSACPKELATEILSDSDHTTKVAPTTLNYMAKRTYILKTNQNTNHLRFILTPKTGHSS